MAMKILSSICTGCGLCAEKCPMGAVIPGTCGDAPVIRTDRCTECVGHFAWPRCVALCPVRAVRRDLERTEGRNSLLAKWFALTGKERFERVIPPALEPVLETGESGT